MARAGREFVLHHLVCVRNPARLREKWRNQQGRMYGTGRIRLPKSIFNWLPHKWDDPDFRPFLAFYDGRADQGRARRPGRVRAGRVRNAQTAGARSPCGSREAVGERVRLCWPFEGIAAIGPDARYASHDRP